MRVSEILFMYSRCVKNAESNIFLQEMMIQRVKNKIEDNGRHGKIK
jgi:hypothetical protein